MDLPCPAPSLDVLDADELFMLGLRASAAEDGATALSCLKLAVARQPAHARAHWMLGAEYAALRMPERATEHFARAVELDPAQPVARFQYGLLLLTCGEADAAESVWRGLAHRPEDDPLRRFATGLLRLARGHAAEALPELAAAAADPATPPALRRDVESVIARIEGAAARTGMPAVAAGAAPVEDGAAAAAGQHAAVAAGVEDQVRGVVGDPAMDRLSAGPGMGVAAVDDAMDGAARSMQSHLALSAYGEAGRGRG